LNITHVKKNISVNKELPLHQAAPALAPAR
jgi:hypothetical protein